MPEPMLIVVSGPPGAGKTTLAHLLGPQIGCPVISRDEIKEGIVHADGGGEPDWGGPVSKRTFETFFATLELLLTSGVSTLAEAAFQHELWHPEVSKLATLAEVRVVACAVDPATARDRMALRLARDPAGRAAHPDREFLDALDSGQLSLADFDPLAIEAPTLSVDTTDGYAPALGEIVSFLRRD